ncbi:protein IWS1 homolog [Hoplias malabaricus]|uniref:protein IWS1 homolog n=1 Tax=Hoplias malabaricus TaxID=27720 RepID=UPI003462958E
MNSEETYTVPGILSSSSYGGTLVTTKKVTLLDSGNGSEITAVRNSRAISDDVSNSDEGSGASDKTAVAKLQEFSSQSEDYDHKMRVKRLIADIFGESDDEEEVELDREKQQSAVKALMEAAESSDGEVHKAKDTPFMSDFDIMLARKKALSGKRKRHQDGGTSTSDARDVARAMITKMTEAAEEDRMLNSQKKPALKKLMLLSRVVMHLKKQDLKETFIDSGVMTAIKEWISPLPDKSLPALRIREELLKILQELPSVSQETLKMSGIGRAVMFLYKHPKESRPNKDLALKLINEWFRTIFGLSSNYNGRTTEERQQRDLDKDIAPRRQLYSSGEQIPQRNLEDWLTGGEDSKSPKRLRQGDPGFCMRAKPPTPSSSVYVIRPKWNVEPDSKQGPVRKRGSRGERQMKLFAKMRRMTKPYHAMKISVDGNRLFF